MFGHEMTKVKPLADPALVFDTASVLAPVLEDRALMALLKNRYMPLAFMAKRVNKKLSIATMTEIVQALTHYSRQNDALGIHDLGVHFAMVSDVLHVGGGRGAQRGVHKPIEDVGASEIRSTLSPQSRLAARNFNASHYEVLKKQYDLYERVLRECERCTSLVEARGRIRVQEDDWQRLKGTMARFGLVRDVVYGRSIFLEGGLVREIEQKYMGQRVDDVAPRLLRGGLDVPLAA